MVVSCTRYRQYIIGTAADRGYLRRRRCRIVRLWDLPLPAELALAGAAIQWRLVERCDLTDRRDRHRAIAAIGRALREGRIAVTSVARALGPKWTARICTAEELLALRREAMAAGDVISATRWLDAAADKLAAAAHNGDGRRIDIAAPSAPPKRVMRRVRTADGGEPHMAATPVDPGRAPRPVAVGRVSTTARP
jgi:hypothetical protein